MFVFAFFLMNEYRFSQYTMTKNLILSDILTIKTSINPAAITNRFVFISGVDLASSYYNLSDDIFNVDIFHSHTKAVILKRQAWICSPPRDYFSFDNEWRTVTQETKYSPDISKTIYNDIKIGNFTIAEDIFDRKTLKTALILPKSSIYKDFSHNKKNKFIYTYIGRGWFYHMNKGNVSRSMMKMTKSFSFDGSEALSIIIKIILSLVFHSFFYISTGSMNSGSQMSNADRVAKLMSNCNENDVRIRYLHYTPSGRISIVAFKDRNLLMSKEINGFTFGNVIQKIAKSPEEVIPQYPPNFQLDVFNYQKFALSVMTLILIFTCGSRNKYRRDLTIVIVGALVILIRSSIWRKKYLLFISSGLLTAASIVYRYV